MPEDVRVDKAPPTKSSGMPFQKRKQLERDIQHISEEMYKRNKELAETNKALSLLGTIDALVLESHASLKTVSAHITEAIAQVTDYSFVALLTRSVHSGDELVLNGWSGSEWLGKPEQSLGFSRPLHLKLTHEWFELLESTKLVSLKGATDEELAEFMNCTPAEVGRVRKNLPLKSLYIVKLTARRQIVGLLVIGFLDEISEISESDKALLDRLSESIGVALDNKLLFEENKHIVRQLRESNTKLQALDEAKDDFISMASHQLRTPLTSIKGYTSMVLEGDAGKITPTQEKLLTQSFYSSQRMVYLIADLLNVSRLRTGKFVIETTPVDMAEMVDQELMQVKQSAASRSLTLDYKKPKKFPKIMIDDVKTRQVIMNFTDNAIYYTPAGGHIEVSVTETDTTVEFRVKDNGLGVPKADRPHLFTKFYRAGNARKARPDGTGLGLFMAKKVIVAQGGVIIFETEEGKGSTFGFKFAKSKVAMPDEDAKTDQKPAEKALEKPSSKS